MAELYFLLPSHLRVSCKCAGGGAQGRVDWETETWGSIGADGFAVSFVVGSVTVLPQKARP